MNTTDKHLCVCMSRPYFYAVNFTFIFLRHVTQWDVHLCRCSNIMGYSSLISCTCCKCSLAAPSLPRTQVSVTVIGIVKGALWGERMPSTAIYRLECQEAGTLTGTLQAPDNLLPGTHQTGTDFYNNTHVTREQMVKQIWQNMNK